MKRTDLHFDYPESLVAQVRVPHSRVMWVENAAPVELSLDELTQKLKPGDLLVINNTKVVKRRLFSQDDLGRELEVLFLEETAPRVWKVLFPISRMKGEVLNFPAGVQTLKVEGGRIQTLTLNQGIDTAYFEKYGEMPLPPYIQKARGERHNVARDSEWYQTAWAEVLGSQAAPTASLHFQKPHLDSLRARGVQIESLTLHVGLGTFFPIHAENLESHEMHGEDVFLSAKSWDVVRETRQRGGRIWALGTTVTRALESMAHNRLRQNAQGDWYGRTNIFIYPPYDFQVVDRLLTNFHQPESTLLALVAAFAGLETVKSCYAWAIENQFRLFSYGDLTAWVRPSEK